MDFLLDLVVELDLSSILIPAQAKDPRGEKGFDPRMMTMLLLYAYCVGIVSSRKIERACYEDLAFRVLTGNQQPDHTRISEFRRRNLDSLRGLFVQILRLCQKAGVVSLGHVALDGTKVQANASMHKAMSHERMLRAEKQLEKEINALMRKAEILDAQEDRRYGKGKLGSELLDELRRRQDRLARIRQARKEMEAETAAAAARQRHEEAEEAKAQATAARESDAPAAEKADLDKKAEAAAAKARAAREKAIEAAEIADVEPPDLEPLAPEAMPRRGLARRADGTPQNKTQRNFTDADSHLMKSDSHYIQGYNCQLAVDSDYQVIVAVGVSNQPPDVEHLEPMLVRIAASAGALPTVMTMDAGYWSDNNANACADQGIDAYIATGRLPHGQPPPPKCGPLPRNADAKARMARKIRSKKGAKIYAQRKAIVEPVNGQIKEARGLRRFLLKGIEKVSGEWHLIAATHNLLKLFRFRRSQQQALVAATG
ncbi:transposase [Synechococcus sp. CS-602]|uniref:transposase n=1 Tax=Synechococcaceae TaxID=1890426 RepID=UPI0009F913C8|nr:MULTISPECIES: transposase [Synechococcaceae]MCT4363863.1 transposase [Candidatus Regnicoccus frigidus MAG-AL1]MCT0204181.1 transposase [Synechococcus sp. CS-602]MCT0245620.1 transposase [Synechococcus sp. CS-601]MCT4368760.1 transposase [Candidatus Regnicoccus frigidus MAG-AL2]TWB87416.1 transposase [Synechococcus sp. Ace-Pa]